jgi:outer membrane protein TolC
VADEGVIGKNPAHLLSTYDLGLQVNFSLFDGKRRDAQLEEQSAVLRDLTVQGDELQRQIGVDVRAALLDLTGAREQVDAARDRLALGEQEVTQARDRFAAGVAGNADAITASLALTGARTQLVDALAAYQAARIALARANGTLTALR